MRLMISMVAAISLVRESLQHQRRFRGLDRPIPLGLHPALSVPLRLLTTVAPVLVHNAVRGVEELSPTSPECLQ